MWIENVGHTKSPDKGELSVLLTKQIHKLINKLLKSKAYTVHPKPAADSYKVQQHLA